MLTRWWNLAHRLVVAVETIAANQAHVSKVTEDYAAASAHYVAMGKEFEPRIEKLRLELGELKANGRGPRKEYVVFTEGSTRP